MKKLERGTPAFGVCLGLVLVAAGALIMAIGFWKTLLLAALFAVGYFLGAVNNKTDFVKEAVERVVPEKKEQTINFREELEKEQDIRYGRETEETGTTAPEMKEDEE